MKLGITLAMVLTVSAPGLAHAGPVADALEALGDAIDEVSDEGGRCKREVLDTLNDAEDDLKDLKRDFDAKDAKKLQRSLEKAAKAAKSDCSKKAVKALNEAIDALDDALADAGDDEEEDDRGSSKKKKKKAVCWNNSDPGCDHTKNGNSPMNKAAFDSFMSAVRGAKPHVYPMQDMVKSMIGNQYLTSMQLSIVVEEFKPHIYPMQDVVKICAPRLVDPQNGGVVSAQFKPHVFPMQDVAQLIAAQKGD